MPTIRIAALIALAFLTSSLPTDATAQRKPVPGRDAQQTATQRIQAVFAEEYKSTDRQVQAKLAGQLLELARSEKGDAAKFTLYREAVRFASQAGDAVTALQATDAMGEQFAISSTAVKSYALSNVSKATLTNDLAIAAADACTSLVHELVADNDFAQAETVVGYGLTALRKVRNPQRINTLRELGDSIGEVARRYRSVAQYAETLKESPNDPTANLEVGKFECFVKGNWKTGLAHLSKGDDAALKELADETLAQSNDAKSQFEIGNGWWLHAGKLEGVMKDRVLAYAGAYYQRALPGLTGLSKVTVEKRLGEVPTVADSGVRAPAPRMKTVNLVELLEADKDFKPRNKWAVVNGVLQCTEGHFNPKVVVPYQPPEEYDITLAMAQPKLRNHVGIVLPNPTNDTTFAFKIAPREYGFASPGDKYVRKFPREILQAGVKYTIVISVRKEGLQATINGEVVAKFPTDFSDVETDHWARVAETEQITVFCDDPTVFYQLQITEISGEGAMTRFPTAN